VVLNNYIKQIFPLRLKQLLFSRVTQLVGDPLTSFVSVKRLAFVSVEMHSPLVVDCESHAPWHSLGFSHTFFNQLESLHFPLVSLFALGHAGTVALFMSTNLVVVYSSYSLRRDLGLLIFSFNLVLSNKGVLGRQL